MENFTLPYQYQKKEKEEGVKLSFEDAIAGMTLKDLELAAIKAAFKKIGNHKCKVAKALGITPRGLYNKLHSYGLMEDLEDPNRYKKPTKAKLITVFSESVSINHAARKLGVSRLTIRKYMRSYGLTDADAIKARQGK